MFYFSTQEKHIHKLTAMQTVNCTSSQLLNDGYEVTDTILNVTLKSWLRVEEGIKEKYFMPMFFEAYILLYSSTCSFGRLCVMFWEIQFLNSDIYLKRLLYNLFMKNYHLCSQKHNTLWNFSYFPLLIAIRKVSENRQIKSVNFPTEQRSANLRDINSRDEARQQEFSERNERWT